MGRALVIIASAAERAKAVLWVQKAPWNTRITFQGPKRTLPQNDKMWAMLTDVSRQQLWHGVRMAPDDWKQLFLDALGREMRLIPNLAGTGFVNLRGSSSDLSIEEMSDMIELMLMFGASPDHPVTFTEPKHADEMA